MVAFELHVWGRCIPGEKILPGVDPHIFTAGALKALLGQKLSIPAQDLKFRLGGWMPLADTVRVQDFYAKYYEESIQIASADDSASHRYSVVGSGKVIFNVETGRLFFEQAAGAAELELKDEEELGDMCALDKLVLHMTVATTRLPSKSLPWAGSRGTVVVLVIGPNNDVTRHILLTTVTKSTTIAVLKTMISEETGMGLEEQLLQLTDGIVIGDDDKDTYCWQLGIKAGSFITVKRVEENRLEENMTLCCKTLAGKTLILTDCKGATTVHQFKEKIHMKEQFPPDEQRLIFDGHQLEDQRTLAEYNLKSWDTIILILRLRGGMFHVSSGRIDLQQLRALTTKLQVKMVRRGLCIGNRIVRIDGTMEARRLSEALSELHNEAENKVRELEAKKKKLEEAIAKLKADVPQHSIRRIY